MGLLQDWESALSRVEAILEFKRARKHPLGDLGQDRVHRADGLCRLRRFGEAKAELEACFPLFENDPSQRARVFGCLAALFGHQSDLVQAVTQERRALALRESLPGPKARAASHNNLANYLELSRAPSALADPAFRPLDDWLRQRQVNLAELQATLDPLLDQARHSTL